MQVLRRFSGYVADRYNPGPRSRDSFCFLTQHTTQPTRVPHFSRSLRKVGKLPSIAKE